MQAITESITADFTASFLGSYVAAVVLESGSDTAVSSTHHSLMFDV